MLDFKPTEWWKWPRAEQRCSNRLAYYSRRSDFRFRFDAHQPTAYVDLTNKVVGMNPNFPVLSDQQKTILRHVPPNPTQFWINAYLAHEAGHIHFTSVQPIHQPILMQLVNILEDERIERLMVRKIPDLKWVFHTLGDILLQHNHKGDAYSCCLLWRWYFDRFDLNMPCEQPDLWEEIKPLVEAAWVANDTGEVLEIANTILQTLQIPLNQAPPPLFGLDDLAPQGARSNSNGTPQSNDPPKQAQHPAPAKANPRKDPPEEQTEPTINDQEQGEPRGDQEQGEPTTNDQEQTEPRGDQDQTEPTTNDQEQTEPTTNDQDQTEPRGDQEQGNPAGDQGQNPSQGQGLPQQEQEAVEQILEQGTPQPGRTQPIHPGVLPDKLSTEDPFNPFTAVSSLLNQVEGYARELATMLHMPGSPLRSHPSDSGRFSYRRYTQQEERYFERKSSKPRKEPPQILVAIDISGSMMGSKLRAAKEVGATIVRAAQILKTQFEVRFFNDLDLPLAKDPNEALEEIALINAHGLTVLQPTLAKLLQNPKPSLVIIICDGELFQSDYQRCQRIIQNSPHKIVPVLLEVNEPHIRHEYEKHFGKALVASETAKLLPLIKNTIRSFWQQKSPL